MLCDILISFIALKNLSISYGGRISLNSVSVINNNLMPTTTTCPRSVDPYYKESYHIKRFKNSWTNSTLYARSLFFMTFLALKNYSVSYGRSILYVQEVFTHCI